MSIRYQCLLLWLLVLTACAGEQRPSDAEIRRLLPPACPHWAIGIAAPKYMEAWVETLEVKDDRGRWVKIPQGVVGEFPQTAGWPALDGIGSGSTTVSSAGAPTEIFVRWQSLAEPQTYTWQFTVPESLRQALRKQEMVKPWYGPAQMSCRNDITIGVAPGGRTIVFNDGFGFPATEILRGQAEVEPLGPGQGWGKGYAYPLTDKAKQYIQDHGIPYGSWGH